MNSQHKFLPSGLDLSPGFGGVYKTSPKWTQPGSLFSASNCHRNDFYFGLSPFFPQAQTLHDEDGNALRNLCGHEVYQYLDKSIDAEEGSGDPPYLWSGSGDYVFDETPGMEELIYRQTTNTSGSIASGTAGPFYESPSIASYYRGLEESGARKTVGSLTLSNALDIGYLTQKIEAWLGKSFDFREATAGDSYANSYGAFMTESSNDKYAALSGSRLSSDLDASSDTTIDGSITVYGYDAEFKGAVPIITRKNLPIVRDLSSATSAHGIDAYKSGTEGIELTAPITTKHWKDDLGTYTRRDPSAFSGVGFGVEEIGSGLVPTAPSSSADTSTLIGFLGIDGKTTFKVTIETGYLEGEDFISVSSNAVTVIPLEMSNYLIADYNEDAETIRITNLEAKRGSGPFETVEILENTIGTNPINGCVLLAVVKKRSGSRWGHPRLDSPTPPADYQDLTFYRSKKIFKNLEAKTI